jgi:hypothetical protein
MRRLFRPRKERDPSSDDVQGLTCHSQLKNGRLLRGNSPAMMRASLKLDSFAIGGAAALSSEQEVSHDAAVPPG